MKESSKIDPLENAKNSMLLVMTLLALPILLINIEYTGIAVVIPSASLSLGMSLAKANWIAMTYLLIFSAFIITGGRLGDLYSAKLVMLSGLIVFTVGSLIGGISVTAWQIILGRGVQGLGAAIAFPNVMSIAYNCAPDHRKGFALGLLAGIVGLSMAIGPPLAGALTTYFSWRWFFLINVPIGLITCCVIACCLPEVVSDRIKKIKLDIYGIILLSILLSNIIYALNVLKGGFKHSYLLVISIIVIIISLALFVYNEKKVEQPLIHLDNFSNIELVIGCLVRASVNFGFYIVLFLMGLYLHFVMALSASKSGFILFPMSILMGIFSFLSGKLIDRYGVNKPTIVGLFLLIICYISLILLPIQKSVTLIILLLSLYGISYTVISPGLLKLTMNSVDESSRGLASGIFYMMSVFGSTIGLAITGIILHIYHTNSEKSGLIAAFPKLMSACLLLSIVSFIMLMVMEKINRRNQLK